MVDALVPSKDQHLADIAAAKNRANHTGLQSADTIVDGTNNHTFTAADDVKLGTIASGATANATDVSLRDRETHTGTQAASTVSDFVEVAQDAAAAMFRAGTNVTFTYDDAANTFTINASGGGAGTTDPEVVRDTIGGALVGGANIQITVNDAADTITIAVIGLAAVATSGVYTDLSARPTLGTAAAQNTSAFDAAGAATAAQAAAVQRANHTGTQSSATISDFTEAVQDAVASLLGAGSNITLNYDDTANTLTITAAAGGGLDAEAVRDAIGVALIGAGNITVAVNDAADTITISTTATANSTDASLRDRSTHTGTQAATTITGLATVATTGAYADLTGKPAAGAGAFNDRGAWVTATAYAVSDVVSISGIRYVCKIAHTSSTTFATDKTVNWVPVDIDTAGREKQLYNATSDTLRFLRSKKALAFGGTDIADVVMIGDSITFGYLGTPGVNDPMTQVANHVSALGLPLAGTKYHFINADSARWTTTGSVSLLTPYQYATMSTGATLTYNPGINVGSFDLVYMQWPSGGSFTYQIDSGATTAVSAVGTAGYVRIRIDAGTVGAHTLKITATANNTYILKAAGNSALAAAASGMRFSSCGQTSSTLSTWTTTRDTTAQQKAAIGGGAFFAVIMLETNDYMNQLALTTYRSQYTTLITDLQGLGASVALMTTPPPQSIKAITLAQYTAVIYDLADTYGCAVLDIAARWKDWTTGSSLGLYLPAGSGGDLHPSPQGYADLGQAVLSLLAA